MTDEEILSWDEVWLEGDQSYTFDRNVIVRGGVTKVTERDTNGTNGTCPAHVPNMSQSVPKVSQNVSRRVPSMSPEAVRKRQYRAKKRLANVPEVSGTCPKQHEREKEKRVEKKKKSLSRAHVPLSRFPEFKAAYPRRDGAQGWPKAEKQFDRLVAGGVSPDVIIDAAKAYAVQERSKGKEGTEFIKMAVTWLNQEGWKEDLPAPKLSFIELETRRSEIARKFMDKHGVIHEQWRVTKAWKEAGLA